MRIATVIGTVTLSGSHASLRGATFRVAVPHSLANLDGSSNAQAEELVVYDELGAGLGSQICVSEGGEAAQAFRPELKPVDAYNAAILDRLEMLKSEPS